MHSMKKDEMKQQLALIEQEIKDLVERRGRLAVDAPGHLRQTGSNLVKRAQIGACDRQLSVLRAKYARIQTQIDQLDRPALSTN